MAHQSIVEVIDFHLSQLTFTSKPSQAALSNLKGEIKRFPFKQIFFIINVPIYQKLSYEKM